MNWFCIIFLILIEFCWGGSEDLLISKVICHHPESKLEIYSSKEKKFQNLKGYFRNIVHLKSTIKILASDGGYKYFNYQIIEKNNQKQLEIFYEIKPIIRDVKLTTRKIHISEDLLDSLNLKKNFFFDASYVNSQLLLLKKKIDSLGYPYSQIVFDYEITKDVVDLNIKIHEGSPRIFKKVNVISDSVFVVKFLEDKFISLYNHPFDFTKFKAALDEAERDLFNYGYYLINIDLIPKGDKNKVLLELKISNDQIFLFNFKKIDSSERENLLQVAKNLFRQFKKPLTKQILKQGIAEEFKKKGYIDSEILISQSEFKNKFLEKVSSYEVVINKGNKIHLNKLEFFGNVFFDFKKLKKFYDDQAFELASNEFLDLDYLDFFKEFLRNEYIKNGFLQVRIDDPDIRFNKNKQNSSVRFLITEGNRTLVKKIRFKGLPSEFQTIIFLHLRNREGNFFNPIELNEDIKKITDLLHEGGYYFAEISNTNDDTFISFSQNNSEVEILFNINSGNRITLNKTIFLGNYKTRKKILERKIFMQRGDLITPKKTKELENILSSLGLFNSVSVTPIKHGANRAETDLIIKLSERDFGLVELAPGFRSDIGLKLSGTVSYLNLGGENKSISLKSQINQRLNFQTFDPRRRKERKQLLEHNTSISYNQYDIYNSEIDLGLGSSFQRKRFYSFDADLWRINSTLSKDITNKFSTSLRYQWETISQTDATEIRDNGSFQIGAITPSATYDLRNNPINPSQGAFFNLSCEFANPYFLSQDNQDLTVNYYKLVSRNRLYLPFKNGTLAFSLVGGIQENLATRQKLDANNNLVSEGYIPNIKVFRLTGMDIVRGFNDEEINRLPDGQDITEVQIDKRAYLANLKVEPRFFLTDNIVAGAFYDAGRVFVQEFDLGTLRDSVGLTFKILTPVGTLDFDYGIKLLRKRNQDGTLEDPGRFHVSIGFF